MREAVQRRVVLTQWTALAVGVAGVGSVLSEFGDPTLVVLPPLIACVVGWLLNREPQRQPIAGLVLVIGCLLGPIYGVATPEAEQSVIAEVMWITVGTILGTFVLSLRVYSAVSCLIILAVTLATVANPRIPLDATLYFSGFLSIITALGLAALKFVETQDERVHQREVKLRAALESAQQRTRELVLARTTLHETRSQLVHLGRLASLGEVASEVAHELNNPLTTVLMSSEVLQEALVRDNPELAPLAREIQVAARACADVTERVLWYGRRKKPIPTPVTLASVVEQARTITHTPLRRARCQLSIDLEPDLVLVGDMVQLTQVFVNLFINAKTVMRNGGSIRVRGERDGDHIYVTVTDEGPGIDTKLAEQIFEPFFTTRPDDGGSGLGLAISRAVIETHGGTLTLESTQPAPACFRIQLPAPRASTTPIRQAAIG